MVKRSCSPSNPEPSTEKKGRGDPISVQLFPPELVEHIVSFLPVRDIVSLARTCRYFRQICDAERVWRRICQRLAPRLHEQRAGGARPWKRAAVLNYTKGLYFQTFGGRRRGLSKSVAPFLAHGYRRFLPTKDHVFILDYLGTLFFLKNAFVSSTLGHFQWKRACRYILLCRGAKDLTSDPRSDTVYRKYLYVLVSQAQPAAGSGTGGPRSQPCDCVEVYLQSSGQRVFQMTFHHSMRFKQIVLVGQEAQRALLLLSEEGRVYSLMVNETQLDQSRSYTVQLMLRKVSRCLPHLKVVRMSSNQSSILYIMDQGGAYFEVHTPGVYRDLFGSLHAFDPLDQEMPLALALPAKVSSVQCPVALWCGLNHSLALSQGSDFSKELLGCGCGAGGRLPGWPKGSATFVKLHVKVPPCTRSLCSSRECLYLLSGHDVEHGRAYKKLPGEAGGGPASEPGTSAPGASEPGAAARGCEAYLNQLLGCPTLHARLDKMKEIVGWMALQAAQKDFFWEALDLLQRAATPRDPPPPEG
ncbi:F-box only protein 24 isoform X2 [Ornithorhynchus anatinus]|uniref:F-box only protein 24 isoform X2 n=1 Tax=Ornithorhynchus anatinus TaxID=9258 RepID=UPI0010A79605|nr:F-box only protein 24 isoform X2 [Ornithorhynchus anatinus]